MSSSPDTGRGAKLDVEQSAKVSQIIQSLEENSSSGKATEVPSSSLNGCWKLLYTSTPGTNSPIQRTFTASDQVSIYQNINLQPQLDSTIRNLPEGLPEVSNVICFGDKARLRVTALASTITTPLIAPRKNDGRIFGLNLFGVSSSQPAKDPAQRIDFAFQYACFEFAQPLLGGLLKRIPYPVPFRLPGDEAKGWIDNTYLSEDLRIARGNKGTIFVLQKVKDLSNDAIASFSTLSLLDDSSSSIKSKQADVSNKQAVIKQPVKQSKAKQIYLIFPAQLGTGEDYADFEQIIKEELTTANSSKEGKGEGDVEVLTVPLPRITWPLGLIPSFFSKDYLQGTLKPSKTLSFYFDAVDTAIYNLFRSLSSSGESLDNIEITLIGHSIGGWVARAWLSEWSDPVLKAKVKRVITLGTAHNPPPVDSQFASLDQTRGLLTYINDQYPGAFEKNIDYISIAGSKVTGRKPAELFEGAELSLVDKVQEVVAYLSYLFLAGRGDIPGDGIIPVETATLSGARQIIVEDVRHSDYIPSIGKSIRLPVTWYGSKDVVKQWLPSIVIKTNKKINR